MATARAQKKWRDKHRFVKRQLNVMARKLIHDYLDEITKRFALRGKGEAAAFACFVTMSLVQRAEYEDETARMLNLFTESYRRDRDLFTA